MIVYCKDDKWILEPAFYSRVGQRDHLNCTLITQGSGCLCVSVNVCVLSSFLPILPHCGL